MQSLNAQKSDISLQYYRDAHNLSCQNCKELMSPMTIISVHKFITQQSKLKHKFTNTVCHIMHVGFRN